MYSMDLPHLEIPCEIGLPLLLLSTPSVSGFLQVLCNIFCACVLVCLPACDLIFCDMTSILTAHVSCKAN